MGCKYSIRITITQTSTRVILPPSNDYCLKVVLFISKLLCHVLDIKVVIENKYS